ncbi:hypothetical protein N7522_002999 [Penicillium canescens]|nr:hypothetical protein N7522_002999 [Penicillium canescens]
MHEDPDGSTISSSAGRLAASTPGIRRHIACVRCRRRKQRCDALLPACTNCARAGVECFQGPSASNVSRSRLHYLESRVRELEGRGGVHFCEPDSPQDGDAPINTSASMQTPPQLHAPEAVEATRQRKTHPIQGSPITTRSPSVSVPGSITRDHPLSHEVGLLSLANASDPKYLGPSSGVPFARLIYESAPQSQGLSLSQQNQHSLADDSAAFITQNTQPADLPAIAECQQYAEAYFEVAIFLPFLLHDDVFVLLDSVHNYAETGIWNQTMPVTLGLAQVFLLLSLGARQLETKLKADFNSNGLLASGMRYGTQIKLHDTVEGVQTLLLMTLNSFYNPAGLNSWFLLHTILASCLDLGLQRQSNVNRASETDEQRKRRYLRSAIFWSAYSLDRILTVILGRPLTLRDEAIDVEFPGMDDGSEIDMGALQWAQSTGNIADPCMQQFVTCIYALRFDRIIAEIKLMIYRVSRAPQRFPWPTDIPNWQRDVENSCRKLIGEVESRQRSRYMGISQPLPLLAVQKLQLRFHQTIMLLYRPSPQVPRPTPEATRACFDSAIEVIRISAELHRFTNMECTWLSAHSLFVAAITTFYCLWTSPAAMASIVPATILERVQKAHDLLEYLSETWSVARDACEKLSRLIPVAFEGYEPLLGNGAGMGIFQPREEPYQAADTHPQQDDAPFNSAMDHWSQQGKNALVDELGILRELFDLDWLDNAALDPIFQSQ